MKYSLLDVAAVAPGEHPADALHGAVPLARAAERSGYERVWYAEHHNMPAIASAATSVLIAHVAAHTERIRLGAGGVMLPNHSPLVIAEQFGTLAALHPGPDRPGPRPRAGLRPGDDAGAAPQRRSRPTRSRRTCWSCRASSPARPGSRGCAPRPATGRNVPLYILGSSLFGAQLAAALGLPYAFASHFAPDALEAATELYREEYRPSEANPEPYLIVAANLIAAPTEEEARGPVPGRAAVAGHAVPGAHGTGRSSATMSSTSCWPRRAATT